MKITTKFFLLILSIFILSSPNTSAEISISVTGNLSDTIDANDLVSGAGSDLHDTYESPSNQVEITISGTSGDLDEWRVDISKIDSTWFNDLHYYAQRTSDGSGSGSISGGSTYQEVTGSDLSFFSGSGDRSAITVQLKLSGVSVQVPQNTYGATVYFTIVDTGSKGTSTEYREKIPVIKYQKSGAIVKRDVKRKNSGNYVDSLTRGQKKM